MVVFTNYSLKHSDSSSPRMSNSESNTNSDWQSQVVKAISGSSACK